MKGRGLFDVSLTLDFDFDDVISEIVMSEHGKGEFSAKIELSMWEAVSVLAKAVVDETPVNFGHLSGAISQAKEVTYAERYQGWLGEVGDGGIQYAEPVEYGYPPFSGGKGPSRKMVESIMLWIIRKRIQWTKNGKPVPTESMAWAMAWHFAKNGNEGFEMFKKGVKNSKPMIGKIWGNLMDDLVTTWEGRDL